MEIETEVKVKIRDLATLKNQLKKLKAKHIGVSHQLDTYFLVKPVKYRYDKGYPIIRVRQDLIKKKSFLELHKVIDLYRAEEYEVAIADVISAKAILVKLGYQFSAVIDKKRERYQLGQINIDLDTVKGLGQFMEVEVMNRKKNESIKKIYDLLSQLGIQNQDIIPDLRYLDMLWQKQRVKLPQAPKEQFYKHHID